jgi:membrane fusion protein (multidrug efflux system)
MSHTQLEALLTFRARRPRFGNRLAPRTAPRRTGASSQADVSESDPSNPWYAASFGETDQVAGGDSSGVESDPGEVDPGDEDGDGGTPGKSRDEDKNQEGEKDKSNDKHEDKKDKGDGKDDKSDKDGDGKDGGDKAGDGKDGDGKDKKASKKPLIILAVVVLILAIAALIWWFLTRNQVTTDDAYTDGNAVMMAPKVSGYVVTLAVNDNTRVHRGDLLLKIDPRDYIAARDQAVAQSALAVAQLHQAQAQLELARVQYPAQLAQARAQRSSALANLTNAQASYNRQHSVDQRATTQQNVDTATAQQRSAQASVESADAQVKAQSLVPQQIRQAEALVEARQAQVQQAQAQLEQANLNLSYTELHAPSDGWITMRNVQLGTLLQAGTSVFQLVTPEVWITANFKETQLDRMRVGDAVSVTVDAYSKVKLHGHVDSIQAGSGSRFSAFPAENATGNFVKIVQRVPVKIVIDRGLDPDRPLPLGLSVDPTVELK